MNAKNSAKIFKSISKWFVKQAWPHIQQLIIKFIGDSVEWLFDKFKEVLKNSNSRQSKNAEQKAKEAEQMSKISKTKEEAEKYKNISEVWRQVAEEHRTENERLKQEISSLLKKSNKTVKEKVNSLTVDDVFERSEDIKLKQVNFHNMLSAPSKNEQ